ncbi:hypothetical protein VP1G_10886 [Cytospora mali]|uniref:Uncharacterized protein n=1 Tax=Cytospora mali TaxID=578113 RepID=A0A194UYR1_CYTMA|nr:hypothetical protein VP1G_10886 [Valsa mali var. pyri (nom. inval.)]
MYSPDGGGPSWWLKDQVHISDGRLANKIIDSRGLGMTRTHLGFDGGWCEEFGPIMVDLE